MATKSFLTAEDLQVAQARLRSPPVPPDGDERRGPPLGAREFSEWLGDRLLDRLSRHANWLESEPVLLGSWARGELTAKSDIDVLFCGPEEKVRALVQDVAREGLKLRYRMPEDPDDWTKGVAPFDVVALLTARAVRPAASERLKEQTARLHRHRRSLLKAMRLERKARAERYDSISNFLEPNMKYGPGGLRDLEQALVARALYPERFANAGHAFEVLRYYKAFFLLVRHKLQLTPGATDVLSAPEQKPIADWFGYKDPQTFMRELQKGLSRVNFYADWAIAQASASAVSIREVEAARLDSVASLFDALERKRVKSTPAVLWQNRVRLRADEVFGSSLGAEVDQLVGRRLTRILDPLEGEQALLGLFHSRLIDHCLPEFRRINGLVQHDQYHRFTVDAHLLQVLRELKRFCQKPSRGGRLAPFVKALSKGERDVLAMACLMHDLAKGRGGDHSLKGMELARRELARFGKSEKFIDEVCWVIEEHLAMSAAAFRENPRSPSTWRGLADKGVIGDRIRLLTVFTVVDIRGTNPEAWTPWKERLLFELAHQLERPETDQMLELSSALRAAKVKDVDGLVDHLDPFLVGSIAPRILADDLRTLASGRRKAESVLTDDISVRIVSVRRGGRQTWIRFHCREDRAGLFLGFVKWMAASGLAVRHASIHTDPRIGVYDWFEVKAAKPPQQILRLLKGAATSEGDKVYAVRFDAIEMVASDDREWVISFRGRDQSGALTEAARALFDSGAEIRWAKVHTWGRQLDDVFGIKPLTGLAADELLGKLSDKLASSGATRA